MPPKKKNHSKQRARSPSLHKTLHPVKHRKGPDKHKSYTKGGHPTLILNTRFAITQNITAVNLKKLDIAPSLNNFSAAVQR